MKPFFVASKEIVSDGIADLPFPESPSLGGGAGRSGPPPVAATPPGAARAPSPSSPTTSPATTVVTMINIGAGRIGVVQQDLDLGDRLHQD